MDKDFSPAPLDDQDLEALFAAAQRDTPELDPKFLAQLQAQAAAALPQQPAAAPQRRGDYAAAGFLGPQLWVAGLRRKDGDPHATGWTGGLLPFEQP